MSHEALAKWDCLFLCGCQLSHYGVCVSGTRPGCKLEDALDLSSPRNPSEFESLYAHQEIIIFQYPCSCPRKNDKVPTGNNTKQATMDPDLRRGDAVLVPSNHNPYSAPMTNITHKPGIQTIPTPPVIPAQAGIHCVFPHPSCHPVAGPRDPGVSFFSYLDHIIGKV